MRKPLLVAAFSPFGEVLLGNGSSVEELVGDLCDSGFGVEPLDEFVSWVTVADAIDFTAACFHIGFAVVFCGFTNTARAETDLDVQQKDSEKSNRDCGSCRHAVNAPRRVKERCAVHSMR
jgi:hypothetical protein